MSKRLKPFHLSILTQLKSAEEKFSKNYKIGLFVSRLTVEVETITATITATEVAKEHLPGLISGLELFYKEFENKYPRQENGCGGKRERAFIDKHFVDVIANLNNRLTA